jgi:flagellar biosynthesis GTPase FlhF
MSDGSIDESCDEDDDDMTRDERYRAMIQRQSKDRIITMMLLCPYEIKFDSGMTEWVRKQTKDTVLEFFFMNDEEKKAYYTVHGPMHDRKIAAEKAAAEKAAAEKPAAEKAAAEKAAAEKAAAEKAAAEKAAAEKAAAEKAAAEKAAAEKPAAEKAAEEEKAAADEKFRAVLQDESKHRIIMMMFLCPYESKSDRVLTEWLWKQTKDTVIDFFFMNDQEKKAYFTAHVHDIEAPEYTDEHAMEHQHDDYYWRDRELPSNVGYWRVSKKRVE